ncbi:MAG: hypothetical protein IJ695_01210 [Butyrivibrio sp.]|nr:hypothetical protein [Butyrivibrio sp.]
MEVIERKSVHVISDIISGYIAYNLGDVCCVIKNDDDVIKIYYDGGKLQFVFYDDEVGGVIIQEIEDALEFEDIRILHFDTWYYENINNSVIREIFMSYEHDDTSDDEISDDNISDDHIDFYLDNSDGTIYYNENGLIVYSCEEYEPNDSGYWRELTIKITHEICKFNQKYIKTISISGDNFDKEARIEQLKELIKSESEHEDFMDILDIDLDFEDCVIEVFGDEDVSINRLVISDDYVSFKVDEEVYRVNKFRANQCIYLLGANTTNQYWLSWI